MGAYFLLYPDFGSRHIVGEGRQFSFGLNGKALGEVALNLAGVRQEEVDILSVLVSNGLAIELAYNIDRVFSKEEYTGTLGQLMERIDTFEGLLFLGNQNGRVGNDTCAQYIYAFKKGYLSKL